MDENQSEAVASNAELGPLPEPCAHRLYPPDEPLFSAEQMRAYASSAIENEKSRMRCKLIAHRDMSVMSCFASLKECNAARNALQRVIDDA